MHTSLPNFSRFRASATQADATRFAKPRFEGCDLDVALAGCDVMPLVTALAKANGEAPPAQQQQPLRMRVSGASKFSLRHLAAQAAAAAAAVPQGGGASAATASAPAAPPRSSAYDRRGAAGRDAQQPAAAQLTQGALFGGSFALEGLRLNQLDLVGGQTGTISMSTQKIKISSSGARSQQQPASEKLELEIALPDDVPLALQIVPPKAAAAAAAEPATSAAAAGRRVAAVNRAARERDRGAAAGASQQQRYAGGNTAAPSPPRQQQQQQEGEPVEQLASKDSHFLLQRGDLRLSADIVGGGQELHGRVERLKLDELDLSSLRGLLTAASLDADMDNRQGRAVVELQQLRYGSLQADSFSSSVRWEGDILKLEETVLRQAASEYELQGEVLLPQQAAASAASLLEGMMDTGQAQQTQAAATAGGAPDVTAASGNAAADAGPDGAAASVAAAQQQQALPPLAPPPPPALDPNAGRWRLQVVVPSAEIYDILPAAQLLTSLRQPGRDWEATKRAFLETLERAVIQSQSLWDQVTSLDAADAAAAAGASSRKSGGAGRGSAALPGLQDLNGKWNGRLEAYGNLDGPSTIDFNLRGDEWQWGPSYRLDQVTAVGNVDSSEGIQLEELSLTSGPASLSLRGSMLSSKQDASLVISDFPLDLLQPLFDALPLLGGRGAAAAARQPPSYLGPLSALAKRLEATLANLGLGPGGAGDKQMLPPIPNQPLSGVLYASGQLGGSVMRPTASANVRLERGCLGSTRLSGASANLQLNERQRLRVEVELVPAAAPGGVRLEGSLLVPSLADRLGGGDKALRDAAAAAQVAAAQAAAAVAAAAGGDLLLLGELPAAVQKEQEVDLAVQVKDYGMALLTALAPEYCTWQSGTASVDVRVRGRLTSPTLSGSAQLSKATLVSPQLRHPISNLSAFIRFDGSSLRVETLDGRVGRHGSIKVRGGLPLKPRRIEPLQQLLGAVGLGGGASSAVSPSATTAATADSAAQKEPQDSGATPTYPASATPSESRPLSSSLSPPPEPPKRSERVGSAGREQAIVVDLTGLELRVRNVYTGNLDAHVVLGNSLLQPVVSGGCRFSKGVAYLLPQAGPSQLPGAGAGGGAGASAPGGASGGDGGSLSEEAAGGSGGPQPFSSLLQGGRGGAGGKKPGSVTATAAPGVQAGAAGSAGGAATTASGAGSGGAAGVGGGGGADQQSGASGGGGGGSGGAAASPLSQVRLQGFTVELGPELRAIFPVVLTVGLSGAIRLSGPISDPTKLAPAGEIKLEGGVLNLVATQFSLDRQHENKIRFLPEQGVLDPMVDLILVSGDLKAVVQSRASAWQDSLVLMSSGARIAVPGASGAGVGGAGSGAGTAAPSQALGGSAAARMLEERLAEALLAENGQLALSHLASSTFSSLLPKIETQGNFGKARWRLVGAPSLPGLLSLDPFADPPKLLSSLALGTEIEVQYGSALQANMVHKLQESDIGTELTLTMHITKKLRLQAQFSRPSLLRPTVLLLYSSEGARRSTTPADTAAEVP